MSFAAGPMGAAAGTLNWAVHVTAEQPVMSSQVAPGEKERKWPPIASTLIFGEREAVLVDPALTIDQGQDLAAWIADTRKNLQAIFITHGHGDHFLGASSILDRFPKARLLAVPAVVEQMARASTAEALAPWNKTLPGRIRPPAARAEPIADRSLELEGRELIAVEVGRTDMDSSSCLHVPEIGLIVAGDVVYNDVHLHLSESDHAGRLEWLAALDIVESLEPKSVIAGHKRPQRGDDPQIIAETRGYIQDVDRIATTASTARELYDQVLALHPGRLNRGALWSTALANYR